MLMLSEEITWFEMEQCFFRRQAGDIYGNVKGDLGRSIAAYLAAAPCHTSGSEPIIYASLLQ